MRDLYADPKEDGRRLRPHEGGGLIIADVNGGVKTCRAAQNQASSWAGSAPAAALSR